MKKNKVIIFFFIGALTIFFLVGCGNTKNAEQGSGGPKGLTKISVGFTSWPTNMMIYLAQEKGIFEKNGLDVSSEEFSSTTESSNAFLAENLDMCTYPAPDIIAPISRGADFKVIMMTDKSLGSDGLVVKPAIQRIEDLKGKTIATQLYSVDHMYLLTLLDGAGMSSDDVNIVDMSMSDAGNAFLAGQVDAASIWEPYLSKAVAGGGKLLYSTKDNPDLITDCIAASHKFVTDNPEAVAAFVKSWDEAVAYWKEHPEESEALMAKKMNVSDKEFHDMMGTLYITTVQDSVKGFSKAEDASYWGYTQQKIVTFLKKLNVIEKKIDAGSIIDSTFVNEAAK
ncbi:NitT/TauT family transport system substrate-binding protein [Propionispira arboris]|uniref:NitT/TauT family transport system substrate-binding protein n=1 Tax=Propionispira arboris TaxID=84035 RepID=A0A1H6VGA8_9FIRM|nr:ABC transporter substrate-binding protein [Propionispira arboris]SEI99245.1 NitT/TauT family transport system substrate-binding protein [Propionispira arboris]